ncbi:MAG TPA: EAL domain-containing protein [Pyrinomonadaceae bacterium]|nr:EAL domain-containing protein [Pyrinomonadaceae bacterium]
MGIHRHSPLSCDCKSGNRTLVLLAKNFSEDFPEFSVFGAKENWFYYPEYGIVQIEVGTNRRFTGAADVFNFLRTAITDTTRLGGLRAAWLDGKQLLTQQLVQIGSTAEPFSEMVADDSSELLDILQNRRIESWFQPVIEARTSDIWGYECLMRGRRMDGSLVGAMQLLEWANKESLKFMLDRVCRETHLENAGRLNFGADCRFLINFLPTAIYQPEYCLQTSLAAMRRSGLTARQVIFEVVETEKVLDTEHLLRILDFYRKSGFGVALDDMGSGYAGLSLLADLQPDLIKIDREIVCKSVNSKSHLNVCASLVKMGHDNGQLVLAEGVETVEEATLMESLGIDLFQGYYFGKPQPRENLLTISARYKSMAATDLTETVLS